MSRHYIDQLDIWPTRDRMTAHTEPGQWSRYDPGRDNVCRCCGEHVGEYWEITRPVAVHLPDVPLLDCVGPRWHTEPADHCLIVGRGHCWDGASGPAIDDPAAVVASLVHDIACQRVDDLGCVVPGYHRRHWLYAAILRVQGEPLARCAWSYLGLMLGNWFVDLQGRLRERDND